MTTTTSDKRGCPAAGARFGIGGRALLLGLCAASVGMPVGAAQPAASASIYSCVDGAGKRLTSDRPIAECSARDQRVLNPDGSVRQIMRPTLTADERGDIETREREAEIERKQQQEAVRRDRNLLARYPNEAAHRRARDLALEDVQASLRQSEARLDRLAVERKPLAVETEFYVGKPLPLKLKLALDANDAAVDAQKSLVQNRQLEALRIGQLYDAELGRLKRLWAGVPPGALGPVAGITGPVGPRR